MYLTSWRNSVIGRAIDRAYRVAKERGWDRIYWALDLHGTCIESNYIGGEYDWITPECGQVLRQLDEFPETFLIAWSSLYPSDKRGIDQFFAINGVELYAINKNPLEQNTKTGCFDEKFYMSIIVDDKAGFCPSEWPSVLQTVRECREKYGF